MIKHGKIYPIIGERIPHSHLDPIKKHVTRGIADSKEKLVLEPLACDVKGAKKYNGQQCVIAKCLTRTMHPEAVAVGRSMAFVVVDGLAIRFVLPSASRKAVEEFDTRGRVKRAPIILNPVNKMWRLRTKRAARPKRLNIGAHSKSRIKKIGVRAVGGGIFL